MNKKIGLLSLTLAFATTLGVGAVTAMAETSTTTHETSVNALTNENCKVTGASIRFADEKSSTNDIRFEINIDKAVYDTLQNPVISLVVTPEDLAEKTIPVEVLGDKTVNDIAVKYSRAYFYNVPEARYIQDFEVKVKVEAGEVNFVSAPVARSISFVANEALNDTTANYTEEQKTALKGLLPKTEKVAVTAAEIGKVIVGSEVTIPTPEVKYDGVATNKATVTTKVTMGAEDVAVQDGKFVAENVGEYKVVYTADICGVKAVTSEIITVSHSQHVSDIQEVFIDRASTDASKSKIVYDRSVKAVDGIVEMQAPAWGGRMMYGQNIFISELNATTDSSMVIRCYNPTQYYAKYFATFYDENGEYNKGYSNKYRVAPHEHFDVVVSKQAMKDKIYKVDISVQADAIKVPLEDGVLEESFNSDMGYRADKWWILDVEIVDNKSIATTVWENNTVPGFKFYSSEFTCDAEVTPEVLAVEDGIRINNVNGYTYLDFLSDPSKIDMINSKFANVDRQAKYNSFFTYKVTNVGTNPVTIWNYIGTNGTKQNEWDYGWLYTRDIPAGESRVIYCNAANLADAFDLNGKIDVLRLAMNQSCQLVVSDIRILNFGK